VLYGNYTKKSRKLALVVTFEQFEYHVNQTDPYA